MGEHVSSNPKLAQAVQVLRDELKKDKSEGSYYYTWQSNIAVTIMKNSTVGHKKANLIARKFLDLLIREE